MKLFQLINQSPNYLGNFLTVNWLWTIIFNYICNNTWKVIHLNSYPDFHCIVLWWVTSKLSGPRLWSMMEAISLLRTSCFLWSPMLPGGDVWWFPSGCLLPHTWWVIWHHSLCIQRCVCVFMCVCVCVKKRGCGYRLYLRIWRVKIWLTGLYASIT